MATEQTLGLGYSPDKTEFLFIGEAEDEKGSTPWYKWNHDNNSAIPVHEDALTGYINNVSVFNKPFKGKDSYKLHISVYADRKYEIRSGVATTFSRGFVLSLTKLIRELGIDPRDTPLTISVTPGSDDSKAVFCGLYLRGEKIIPTWDSDSLNQRIKDIQAKLNQVVQTKEMMDSREEYFKAVEKHREELKSFEPPKPKERKIKEVKNDERAAPKNRRRTTKDNSEM